MLGNLHVRFGVGAGVRLPGLHHRTKKFRSAASVPRPMQISEFGAVFPVSGPSFRENCSEPIFRFPGGRCNLRHEG